MEKKLLVTEFLNDALNTASSVMVSIWNGAEFKCFNLSRQAAMLIDRVRIYNIHIIENEDFDVAKYITDAILKIKFDFRYEQTHDDIKKFIAHWEEKAVNL